ncbi:MAG: hypothetical protein KJN77_01360 [Gammaproteobacteria bacterium]|nr:hypothetical protein [Gammaproteobacteria bacterium]
MNSSKYAVLIWAFLLATAAVAGDEQRTKIAIAVEGDAPGEQSFHFDSEESGFDLGSLAIGESRVWTDESGNVANIMRTSDGYEIDVAGEKIVLDERVGEGMSDIDSGVEVEEVRKIKMIRKGGGSDVTIISTEPVDDATRQRIREALQDSGNNSEVEFIDGSGPGAHGESHAQGHREIHIIRKEPDATN